MIEVSGLNSLMKVLSDGKTDSAYKVRLWSSMSEYPIMFSLVHRYQPENVIECGTCSGASSLAWALALSKLGRGRVYTWDVADRNKIYANTSLEAEISFHHSSFSETAAPIIAEIQGSKLYFIDGDHRTEMTHRDIRVALESARIEDVLVVHDVEKLPHLQDVITDACVKFLTKRYTIYTPSGIEVVELIGA